MDNRELPLLNRSFSAVPELNSHLRGNFHRVTFNVFPLKADMASLRDFCDSYLNFVDDASRPPFYFKPALPFVILQLLHYPYMADRTHNAFVISQSEVAFAIWLECYAIEAGKLVFKKLALCTPFIYLDNQLSILTGRDVFGYPKAQLRFLPTQSWLDPSTPSPLAKLAIRVTSGAGDVYRPFLDVYQEPRLYASVRRGIPELLAAIPRTLTAWVSLAARTWDTFAHLPLNGYESTRDLGSLSGGVASLANWICAIVPHLTLSRPAPVVYGNTADAQLEALSADIITLKQFRDSDDPEAACYQAIVRSAMYATRFIDAGPLFDPLSLDPASGITVKLHQTHDQPIVESFGLEVIDEIVTSEGSVATLKPIAPFWVESDLVYGLGVPMYWRTKYNSWSSGDELGRVTSLFDQQPAFVTFGGGAVNSVPTRFVTPENVIRVLPLPMRVDSLEYFEAMCKTILTGHKYVIKPHVAPEGVGNNRQPGFIFMIVRSMQNRLVAPGNPLGIYSDHEVEFAILVDLFMAGAADPEQRMVALLPICLFTDSETTEISEREVYGLPTVLATIDSSPGNWAEGTIASAERPLSLLRVTTSIIPALHAGLRPQDRVLVTVTGVYNLQNTTRLNQLNRQSEINPVLKALRAAIIRLPVPIIALKQFPDSRYPERSCYQAIVSRVLRIDTVEEAAYEELDLMVQIYRYPSYPLAAMLALKIEQTIGGRDTVIDVVRPVQPFWIKGAMDTGKAQTVCWRAGASDWQPTEYVEDYLERKTSADYRRTLVDALDGVLRHL
jgi:hypothetical protein